jgi:hypothetical protein
MGGLSDTMLGVSAMPLIDAVHGEWVTILDGTQAGQRFYGVFEHQQDQVLESDLMNDPRGKRYLRFTDKAGNVPRDPKKMVKMLVGGKKYSATRQDFSAFLSVDFELVEIAQGKDI